jgi:uncharacterized protein YbjT (DUF2867 family)|tara:strand:- start:1191 stop:2138 length:948 start_codon:yes stop_codon:yes gene_type:complete
MSLLIIGGTGTLGRQVVKQAIDEGYQVKCLVRNLRRGTFLRDWGAELIYGDLSIPETIPPSLKDVNVIIDAATVRPTDDYNAEKIDWQGKIALIEAAKLANIKKFIFFSVLNANENQTIPLLDLKLKVEKRLQDSGLNYTIFRCPGFFQGLINEYAIPILENQKVWQLGESKPIAYVDTQDAAKAVISSLVTSKSDYKSFSIVGPKSWTSQEIIELCERLSGETAQISYIPFIALGTLRKFFRFFEFTWNIADRLQFSEALSAQSKSNVNKDIAFQSFEFLTLEQYLQEYFGQILRKLKEVNYQQTQRSNDISFL